jgi:hypothetical protein
VVGADGQRDRAGAAVGVQQRGQRAREQPWPHLTLAQEIDAARWARGRALLAREGAWLAAPVPGAELALLARDVAAGEPYRIVHRVSLLP